ncbi:mitochondrial protein Pet127-domain-containing protein [Aspergillus egyptiacus]|nr:mitochondrial protein Pet127-domain-containing protein [Aspergillus egyptiacus]
MFRGSLRSVSDPLLREHVCATCLARGFNRRAQVRFFYSTPVSREDAVGEVSEGAANQSLDDALRNIKYNLGENSERVERRDHDGGNEDSKSKRKRVPAKSQVKEVTLKTQKQKSVKVVSSGEDASAPPAIESSVDNLVKKLQKRTGKDTKAPYFQAQGFPQPPRMVAGAIRTRSRHKVRANSKVKAVPEETAPVPNLSFGLERVLFNPGVYHLRDPRSGVFNFDPYLGSIMPVTEFDFAALKEYITSSKDDTLRNITIKNGKKYMGSSSSMTSVLAHFHYLISAWRPVNTSMMSKGFSDPLTSFSRISRAPSAMFLRYQDGVYAIDADKEYDSATILMNLGKSMEKLLTLPKEQFERYRRSHHNKISAEEEAQTPESYHYSMLGDFMMRSQLDAYDPRLPGTGMFDLKTRAVVSIRMDARNFENGLGYQIKSRFGLFESYEREYFDMIRSAFLKYSLQVRIGRMDGIFVAFHNIERIFGFQYISLPEMDEAIHGQSDTNLGDAEFRMSIHLWNAVLDKATAKYPERSLRFHFEAREANIPFMYIFYEPVTDEEIQAIQTKNQKEVDAYQRRVLKLDHEHIEEDQTTSTESTEEAIEAPETTPITSQDIPADSEAEDGPGDATANTEPTPETEQRELSAMTLTLVNHLNGKRVERVDNFTPRDRWHIEYELTDLEGPQVAKLYEACQKRRKMIFQTGEDVTDVSGYLKKLWTLSKSGRSYRKRQDQLDKKHGVVVLNGIDH